MVLSQKTKYYLPPIFIALLIFVFSSIPNPPAVKAGFDWEYLAHFIEFFLLAFFTMRAVFKDRQAGLNLRLLFLCFFVLVFYAVSDEYHQSFVPAREVSLVDFLIDIVGIITGTIIYLVRKV